MNYSILQIVPNEEGAICGIGDYARILGTELEKCHGLKSNYICGKDGHALNRLTLPKNQPMAFKAVIVHYSAYGYSNRGTPFKFLRSAKQISSRLPILTMFHELEANGSITSSSFWLRPIQLWLIRRAAILSKALHTNLSQFASRLRKISDADLQCTPVFSNLGETEFPLAISVREKNLVVYQPPPSNQDSNQSFWTSLRSIANILNPEQIFYAGRCGELPDTPCGNALGLLDREQAQQLLSKSAWAFMQYPAHCLAKSTMFAAHAANGISTFLQHSTNSTADGLRRDHHYFHPASVAEISPQNIQSAATNLHSWYQDHSVKATACRYAEQIERMISNTRLSHYPDNPTKGTSRSYRC